MGAEIMTIVVESYDGKPVNMEHVRLLLGVRFKARSPAARQVWEAADALTRQAEHLIALIEQSEGK